MIETLTILVDSREQLPYSFDRFENVSVVTAALNAADYSVPGGEHLAAIERKSVNDLIGCLCQGRERFERELHRLRPYHLKAVVVECSLEDISRGRYTSNMTPQSALQSIFAMQVRYSVPFIWAGSRRGGEYVVHGLLEKYVREIGKMFQQTQKASSDA